MNVNDYFKYKKRVVVKIGSSSLQHPQTGSMNLMKIEKLVRELCDLRNQGMDVCLVSSRSNRGRTSGNRICRAARRIFLPNRHVRQLDRHD